MSFIICEQYKTDFTPFHGALNHSSLAVRLVPSHIHTLFSLKTQTNIHTHTLTHTHTHTHLALVHNLFFHVSILLSTGLISFHSTHGLKHRDSPSPPFPRCAPLPPPRIQPVRLGMAGQPNPDKSQHCRGYH